MIHTQKYRLNERFEFKYSVKSFQVADLLAYLRMLAIPDTNTDEFSAYQVSSLYWDTPDLYFYQMKRNSLPVRKKVRWRWYNSGESGLYFEIKNKERDTIRKYSTKMEASLKDIYNDQIVQPELHRTLLPSFSISPSVFIKYTRYAFNLGNCRVTLDTNMNFHKSVLSMRCFDINSADLNILEIKGNDSHSIEIKKLINRYNLYITPFSKYENAINAVYNI